MMTITQLLELHDETCNKCKEIMGKKNSDYTGGEKATDIFANFKASKVLDIQRIQSFTNDRKLQVPNESVDDACEDIINYAILAKAMLTEERELRAKLLNKIEKNIQTHLPPPNK